jgi:hypothetical protein
MTSKFEQLIEYVINDEEAKAKELFHDIVVEKSREIYENLMNEDEEELDETKEEELDETKEEELDESEEEELDENYEELGDQVEMEEEGMSEDEEFDGEEESESGENLEDRVVDLEDKLDELMAEFESLMGDGDDLKAHEGGDALEMDDTEEFTDNDGEEEEFDSSEEAFMENVTLDKAPAPVTSEPAGTNAKSTVAFNSGAKGMQGAPVKMTGDTAQGRPTPKSGDLPEAGTFKNTPGKGVANAKLAAAPKPVTAQAAGVNTKTPFPKG